MFLSVDLSLSDECD